MERSGLREILTIMNNHYQQDSLENQNLNEISFIHQSLPDKNIKDSFLSSQIGELQLSSPIFDSVVLLWPIMYTKPLFWSILVMTW